MANIPIRVKEENKDNGPQIIEAKLPNWLYSPILRHLPTEIIGYIFTLIDVLDVSFPYAPHNPRPEVVMNSTFILGAVCKDWRAIAWSIPTLWSSLVIQLSTNTIKSTRNTLVKDWLARSGQLPLSIHISVMESLYPAEITEELISLFEIISQYSARWYHLELFAPSDIFQYFQSEGSHAPMLEYLRLFELYGSTSKIPLLTSPRLQKVYLTSVRPTRLPWNTVTHIYLNLMLSEYLVEIFRNTPLLIHAELLGILRQPPPSRQIISPVKLLRMRGCDYFLHHISCPLLDELDCDWSGVPQPDNDDFIRFLARSNLIRCFEMRGHAVADSQLIDLLRAVPSVTKLSLSPSLYREDEEEPVNILNILGIILSSQSNSSQPKFLPYLETLEYTGLFPYPPYHPLPENAELIRLQSVTLNFRSTNHVPKQVISFFMELKERGVLVYVWARVKDILQTSIEHYREREESSNRDWSDDLDLGFMLDLS